jgi:hypothetical protein
VAIKINILLIFLWAATTCMAQAPPGFSFQSVLKDNHGGLGRGVNAYVKCQVMKGDPNGKVIYEEVHTIKTNNDGVYTIIIGQGTKVSGDAQSLYGVDWGSGIYYFNIKVVTPSSMAKQWYDPSLDYTDIGTTQLWSVPYALYALKASVGIPSGDAGGDLDGSFPNPLIKQKANLNGSNLINVNGGANAAKVLLGNTDVVLTIKPGAIGNVMMTDSAGNPNWVGKAQSRLVSGALQSFILDKTTTGGTTIADNSFAICQVPVAGANIGDPVFVVATEDNVGFAPYNAFVVTPGIVTVRFVNYQDQIFTITGKKFSLLLVK